MLAAKIATRSSRLIHLTQYFIFLLLIFTAELTVGILAVVFQEKVVADLKTELTGKLKKEYGLASALTAAVDLAQTRVSHLPLPLPASLTLRGGSSNAVASRDPATTQPHCGSYRTSGDRMPWSARPAAFSST